MKRLAYGLLGLLWATVAIAAPQYPTPQGHVTDAAQVLTPEDRARLEEELRAFASRTTVEIAVVTVPSLQDEVIEDYAVGLFKAWGIGKKGKDNGLLILIAPSERQMRIEVGYGLEGDIPDGYAGELVQRYALPAFRNAGYAEGITAVVQAIEARLGGANMPEPPRETRRENPGGLLNLLFFAFFALFWLPAPILGGLAVVAGMLFGLPALGSFALGAVVFLLRLLLGRGRGGGGFPGYYGGGGFGGGFGGSGGFGGFGGGSSGGGGASGRW